MTSFRESDGIDNKNDADLFTVTKRDWSIVSALAWLVERDDYD